MDTGKEYIKMCEKAPEIQEQRKWLKVGDFIANGQVIIRAQSGFNHYNLTWLPHQDQLQEMLIQKYELARGILCRFVEWERENSGITTKHIEFNEFSMEQLWLAFVMKEKYQKKWNGEDWIKDDQLSSLGMLKRERQKEDKRYKGWKPPVKVKK